MGDFTVLPDKDSDRFVENIIYFERILRGETPDSSYKERVALMNKYAYIPRLEELMGAVEKKVTGNSN